MSFTAYDVRWLVNLFATDLCREYRTWNFYLIIVSSALGVMIGHAFEIYLISRLCSSEKGDFNPKIAC